MRKLALALVLFSLSAFADARLEQALEEKLQDESGAGSGKESQWVVIVSKKARKGFYDLLVRNTETKETTTCRWNGTEYAR
jgi:hypothetical protein